MLVKTRVPIYLFGDDSGDWSRVPILFLSMSGDLFPRSLSLRFFAFTLASSYAFHCLYIWWFFRPRFLVCHFLRRVSIGSVKFLVSSSLPSIVRANMVLLSNFISRYIALKCLVFCLRLLSSITYAGMCVVAVLSYTSLHMQLLEIMTRDNELGFLFGCCLRCGTFSLEPEVLSSIANFSRR